MAKAFQWDVPKQEQGQEDSLLACLILLSQYYDNPCSAKTLTTELPLNDNKLTPALFLRAAEKAQLNAEIVTTPLKSIHNLTLPVVLLLNDGRSCVLIKKDKKNAHVLFMETGQGVNAVSMDELSSYYSGVALFVKPTFQFSHRSQEAELKHKKRWFIRTLITAWPIYAEVLIGSALINLFALAIPLFVMNVYDRVVPNHAVETLWVLASGVFIVFIFDFILRTLRGYFIDMAGKKVDVALSAKIFSKILGIRMNVRPDSVGAFSNTVQSFEVFRDFITSTTMTILVDLPFVFLYLLIVHFIGGNLALIPLLMIPVVVLVGLIIQLPLIRLTKKSYQHSAEKQAILIESLSGIEAIKATGAEGKMQYRWEQVTTLAAKLGTKLRFISNTSVNFTLLCQQLVSVSVVMFGVYKIIAGDLTMGALIACTILSGRAIAPMAQVASIFLRYYQSVNALKSINEVMKLPTDINPSMHYLHRPLLKGDIQYQQVSFKYTDDGQNVLNQVNFHVNAGEKIAIIGRLGSGKSTIAKLIMGLYQPSSGAILVDGTDQQQLNPADLRYQIGYVPQDVILFYGSIKENIALGAAHVDERTLLRAAQISGVDSFVSRHPKGYDLQVGERGCNLSGGQRQAIAVARALLLSPSLIVLDEPSASMDDASEQLLCRHLQQNLKASDTLILITHKASMLNLVDRIIVMEHGRVLADGPKDAVLSALKKQGTTT